MPSRFCSHCRCVDGAGIATRMKATIWWQGLDGEGCDSEDCDGEDCDGEDCVASMQWRGLRGEDCDGEDYTLRKLFTITAAVGGR